MKKLNTLLSIPLKSIKSVLEKFNRDSFEDMIDSLAITNYSINKGSYMLFWGIASFTILFIIWSIFASVDQVVRASGVVVPTSKVHTVQNPNTGIIEKINIKMSDEVEKGQVLFLVNYQDAKDRYELSKATRDARERKVSLIEDLVKKGAEAEVRLIDERLLFIEAERVYQRERNNLKFSQIVSPVKGIVSSVDVMNIEQIVNAGDQLASIVPFDDKLHVVASVQAQDIAYVVPGLNAKLAFSAYDMSIYGQFDGVVTKVAPSTTQKAPDSPFFYECIIEIDLNSNQTSNLKNITLQSGMMADVSIIGEKRTILSYIINPISKLSKTALRD
tara:strand:+ start:397 stop:1389 length:993 start_codon:yes stop_codon:yes gene_type:complete